MGGIYYRVQVAHMKLCASRAFWLVAYLSQGHEMLFDAHTRSFAALGGVARRGIYDNMKACAHTTALIDASGKGIDSAEPDKASMSGKLSRSSRRMASIGSTATMFPPH
ncbi:hypothetical protein ABIC63_002750 [Pseudacidovorax sp. 1753]